MFKKKLKLIPVIIATLILVGFGLVPTNKAEAVANCHTDDVDRVCAWNNGANVEAYMTRDTKANHYWRMQLQRYENGRWVTIGTRTGYISLSSPSSRTFTNVRTNNGKDKLKLYVQYYEDAAMTKAFPAKQSEYFYR